MNQSKGSALKRHVVVPMLVLGVAIGATALLVVNKKPVERKVQELILPKVEVGAVVFEDIQIPLQTRGVVTARTQSKLLSEVSGKVVWVSPKWVDGGFFAKDEVMLKIDEQEYVNQVAQAKSRIAQAMSTLVQEQGQAFVAREEWQLRRPDSSNKAGRALALREPQLASAQAQVDAAVADLQLAEDKLKKTRIRAPYAGLVDGKDADIGQYLGVGHRLAEFHAVDYVEIRVPLTQAQIALLELPRLGETADIPVALTARVGDLQAHWQGKLVRTEGLLDEKTKVLYAIVEVDDPYGLRKQHKRPLRIGTFVEAELPSRLLTDVVVLSRRLLRSGNNVWLVDDNNRLDKRQVRVLPTRGDKVYVISGIEAGERVITSGISDAVEGREVRIDSVDEEPKDENTQVTDHVNSPVAGS
ncbi:Toluene efflux pump periplasmic linker protein TtgG [BD1-7 clade bacterium]|uniref:Toluene efflux pump periplasmic linker protein TtgG n=1 Tax=BD1-7 clade bacterium TaxID=2029982 RepID=A0A5S9N230_9GAMM|nr:Toluene efflux pump periplasmic linker protein TtgG [BD1-7 clade bacterium]CAA0082688.1 Toluene efflux pump periplasmic linker protein TtgG [BD1-7 clade bacterium]